MSSGQQIYGSTKDWHLPSPSSTPRSTTFPDSTFQTPKTEVVPQSHFLDAWSTPRVNGQQTPVQTPSFTLSTPIDRPSSSYNQKIRTPEDPEFHVNHFVPNHLALPPVEPARRLSSSPDSSSVRHSGATVPGKNPSKPRPVSMDPSQMQTPPPTRDATSRRSLQQSGGNEFATPATVISRTPNQPPPSDGFVNQTPIQFSNFHFSPGMMPFSETGPMSAPALPQSRLFWDQPNDNNQMDVDMSMASDPFASTSYHMEGNSDWPNFHTPTAAPNQINHQTFQALHGMPSPSPMTSFAASNGSAQYPTSSSFVSTSTGVDPSMVFSFSSQGAGSSFNNPIDPAMKQFEHRQPYETQIADSIREKQRAKMAKSQHSRNSTNSSNASSESTKPGLQRSHTDSGFRKNRLSMMDSRPPSTATGAHVPRRASPLKRQSGGSLTAIPEVRRPRTRLVIDANGTARTETVPHEEAEPSSANPHDVQKDFRREYPGLWEDEDSDTEPDEPFTASRKTSFNVPSRRASKHARTDSHGFERSSSFKMPRPSKSASGAFDKASFDTIRPKKTDSNASRRFSADMSIPFAEVKDAVDVEMPDSPGDAQGALKKMVEGRQKRNDRSSQTTLRAHNQRWAQASTNLSTVQDRYDPFSNTFNVSPDTTDGELTTPSTDRSSISGEFIRCVCQTVDEKRPLIKCESCRKQLHMACVGLNPRKLPPVYVCVFCTGQTPLARGGRVRGPMPGSIDSPLTQKTMFRR